MPLVEKHQLVYYDRMPFRPRTLLIAACALSITLVGSPSALAARPADASWFPGITWFCVLVIVVVGASILVVNRIRNRMMRQRARELDELNTRLRESEALHRMVVEDQTEFIVRWKPDGTRIFANDAYCDLIHKTREEALNSSVFSGIPDADVSRIRKLVGALTPDTAMVAHEHQTRGGNGNTTWQWWNNRGIFDEEGQLVEIQSVGRDITERRTAEAERARVENALRQNEEFLRSTGSAGRVGGWEFDPDSGEIRWSDAMYEIYEVPRDFSLTLESTTSFFPPEDRQKLDEVGRRARETGETYDIELRFVTAAGRRIWVQAIGRPQMVDGRVVKVLGTLQDITRRKEAEKALRMSQRSLEAAPSMIFWVRRDASISYVNDAGCRTLGYTREELLAMSVMDIDDVFTQETWESTGLWEQVRMNGSMTFESVVRRKDGTTFPVEIRNHFVSLEEEEHVFSFLVDITERKEAETKLRDLAIQLSAVEERERRAVATYLHDEIGQTLAVMRMRLSALPAAENPEKYHRAIEEICNLLDDTISDTRALTIDLSPPILYELGLGPAVEWALEKICKDNGLDCEFLEEGEKGLDTDMAAQLFRAARELLMNVVKHARANRVSVYVSVSEEGVHIGVSDDGVGFDVETILLHPHDAGYGLLSIRERMRYIGGSVEIDSTPDHGTRVTLAVPAMPPPCNDGRNGTPH